jgi:hypothetical protein
MEGHGADSGAHGMETPRKERCAAIQGVTDAPLCLSPLADFDDLLHGTPFRFPNTALVDLWLSFPTTAPTVGQITT